MLDTNQIGSIMGMLNELGDLPENEQRETIVALLTEALGVNPEEVKDGLLKVLPTAGAITAEYLSVIIAFVEGLVDEANSNEDLVRFSQKMATLKARNMRVQYEALLSVGFKPNEALTLTADAYMFNPFGNVKSLK